MQPNKNDNCTKSSPSPSAKRIFFSTGVKGGIGKSVFSMMLFHQLRALGERVLLIETETSNADVWNCLTNQQLPTSEQLVDVTDQIKTIEGEALGVRTNLDTAEGWLDLINQINRYPGHTVVVNCASRSDAGVMQHGRILVRALKKLSRPLEVMWLLGTDRDCLEMLMRHREVFPPQVATTHIVLNERNGDNADYDIYHKSKLKKELEKAGSKGLVLTELPTRVMTIIRKKNLTFSTALDRLDLGEACTYEFWLEDCERNLAPFLKATA